MAPRSEIHHLNLLPLFHYDQGRCHRELMLTSCAKNIINAARLSQTRVRFVRWEAVAYYLRRLYLDIFGRRLKLTIADVSLSAMYCANADLIPFLGCAGTFFDVSDPAWQEDGVKTLAAVIYENSDWSVLPILADRLEDAGCGNQRLLTSLRCPRTL